jgi:hypothetical protein
MTLSLVLLLALAGNAFADYYVWDATSGGDWTNASNWWVRTGTTTGYVPSTPPGSADIAAAGGSGTDGVHNYPVGNVTITSGANVDITELNAHGWGTVKDFTLTVEAGASLTTSTHVPWGHDWHNYGGIASQSNSAFTLAVAGTLNVGTWLGLYEGDDPDNPARGQGSCGVLDIIGGVVKVDSSASDGVRFGADNQPTVQARIQISGSGVLYWNGNHTDTGGGGDNKVADYITNGNITGTGLQYELVSGGEYNGFTKVYVPEPATVAILGLGSIALLRRRRV